jgi:tetratricopeptide (TPR) repeat protein
MNHRHTFRTLLAVSVATSIQLSAWQSLAVAAPSTGSASGKRQTSSSAAVKSSAPATTPAQAKALFKRGQFQESAKSYDRFMPGLEKELSGQPALADALDGYGEVLTELNRFDEADKAYKQAIAIRRAQQPGSAALAGSLSLYGRFLLFGRLNLSEAEKTIKESYAIRGKLKANRELELAKSEFDLGEVSNFCNNFVDALSHYQKAIDSKEKLRGKYDESLVECYWGLSQIHDALRDYKRARESSQRALDISSKIYGVNHPMTSNVKLEHASQLMEFDQYKQAEQDILAVIEQRRKTFGEHGIPLASAYNYLSRLYLDRGDLSGAAELRRKALAIYERYNTESAPWAVMGLRPYAMVVLKHAKFAEAEKIARRTAQLEEKIFGAESSVALVNSKQLLLSVYRESGRYTEAEPQAESMIVTSEAYLQDKGISLASALCQLAEMHIDQERLDSAESLVKRALEVQTKNLGPNHPDIAYSLENLGDIYFSRRDFATAKEHYLKAGRILSDYFGKHSDGYATSLLFLADNELAQSNYSAADKLYKEARSIYSDILGPNARDLALVDQKLAHMYFETGNFEEARVKALSALNIRQRMYGLEHPSTATALSELAYVSLLKNEPDYCESLYRLALAIDTQIYGKENPAVASALIRLGNFYAMQSQYAKAEDALKAAVAIRDKVFGENSVLTADALLVLGETYTQSSKFDEAETTIKRAIEISERFAGDDARVTALAYRRLAQSYSERRSYADAEKNYQKALDIFEKLPASKHTDVIWVLKDLAQSYQDRKMFQESEESYKRAVALYEDSRKAGGGVGTTFFLPMVSGLAAVYTQQGKFNDAMALYRRALEINTKASGDVDFQAAVLSKMSGVALESGNLDQSEQFLNEEKALIEKQYGATSYKLGRPLRTLALLNAKRNRPELAESMLKDVIELYSKTLGPNDPNIAGAYDNLATLYVSRKMLPEARAAFARSLQISLKNVGENDISIAEDLRDLALTYKLEGMYLDAEPLLRKSASIMIEARGKNHPALAGVLDQLGEIYARTGDSKAEETLKTALALHKNDEDALLTLINLGIALNVSKKFSDAEPYLRRAIASQKEDLLINSTRLYLADSLIGQRKLGEAEDVLDKSLAFFEVKKDGAVTDRPLAQTLGRLGSIYLLEKRFTEAQKAYNQVVDLYSKANDRVGQANYQSALNSLAISYFMLKKYADSEKNFKLSLALGEQLYGADSKDLVETLESYIQLLRKLNRKHEAEQLYERLKKIQNPQEASTEPAKKSTDTAPTP